MIDIVKKMIEEKGGFINCHAHLDRAFTFSKKDYYASKKHLFDKWKFVDDVKRNSSEEDYYNRIKKALLDQKSKGVQAVLSFIDIDEVSGYRALNAAKRVQLENLGIELKIACQTLKGVTKSKNRKMIEDVIDDLDIIGGLPKVEDFEDHMDILCNWSLSTGKKLHVHVDQLNCNTEEETKKLCEHAFKYGLEGMVTAVHSISLAAHEKSYRNDVYKMCQDAEITFVSCPSAWIDHPRKEKNMVFHNAVTPADELLRHGILVGIGSDNINDIYKPFSDGSMMLELRFLLETNKIYDVNQLIEIAIDNGKKIIGM